MITCKQIIDEARNWLNTPFKHQGRLKHIGCDCLGLVIGVLTNLNYKIAEQDVCAFDELNYSRIPDGNKLLAKLDANLEQIPSGEIKPADILLMKFVKEPQHLAIVTPYGKGNLGIIHSYMQAGKVIEHRLDEEWHVRICKAYRLKDIV